MKQGQSLRTSCGLGRIKYDPSWCKSKPYCVYYRGTACNCFETLQQDKGNLKGKGCKFNLVDNWS